MVLVGDEKQLDGVEAGKPFAQLQRAGMTTATMDEILRQRDAELKAVVRASLAGEVKTAFAKLGDRVAQAEPQNLGHEAAERWLSLSPEQRETAGVIAPTRALRDTINEAIRERLIAEGAVHGPSWETHKLVPRGLTSAEMTRTANYEAGDTVIFNRHYKTLGVDKGDAREVARVDNGTRTVHLRDDRGDIVEWKPVRIAAAKGGLEVYRSETTELRTGDRVRSTRNDPASGLTNGQVAEVETVEKDGVRFRLEDGSLTRLGESDPMLRQLDRAWAATVHAFQGRTVDRIIAAMPAGNAALVNQKSLYVAISRARDRADLITDDPKRLADHLQQATGERIAALDGVARHAEMEAVKQAELPLERHGGHAWDAGDAVDRGRQAEIKLDRAEGREPRTGHETGRGREEKSPRPVQGSRQIGPGFRPAGSRTRRGTGGFRATGSPIRAGKDAGAEAEVAGSGPRTLGPGPPPGPSEGRVVDENHREPRHKSLRLIISTDAGRAARSYSSASLSRAPIGARGMLIGCCHRPVDACAPWDSSKSLGKCRLPRRRVRA